MQREVALLLVMLFRVNFKVSVANPVGVLGAKVIGIAIVDSEEGLKRLDAWIAFTLGST